MTTPSKTIRRSVASLELPTKVPRSLVAKIGLDAHVREAEGAALDHRGPFAVLGRAP